MFCSFPGVGLAAHAGSPSNIFMLRNFLVFGLYEQPQIVERFSVEFQDGRLILRLREIAAGCGHLSFEPSLDPNLKASAHVVVL